MSVAVADPVSRIKEIHSVLRLNAAQGEQARRITDEAHEALVASGVYNLMRPRSFGGAEADMLTFVRAVREASKADGSGGWCAMISGYYSSFAALLPRAGAEEVFSEPTTILAGALAPMGAAVKVPGGYQVSGRWTFGSNSGHASWFVGGAIVIENGAPVMVTETMPLVRLMVFPASAVTIIDTWTSTGLRGTGSNDYAVSDLFVPEERTFWFSEPAVETGSLYAVPSVAGAGLAISAVTVGIAGHAMEAYAELAPNKKPILSPLSLQEKTNIHDRVGIELGNLRAAESYLERVVTDAWDVIAAGSRLNWQQRGTLWLGATHSAQMALKVVDNIYVIAGSSSVYQAGEFDRCLRDAHTASQHVMTQFVNYEIAGKQFLGLDVHGSIWSFDDRGDGD